MISRLAAVFAFLGVALGALAAHKIEFTDASKEAAWKTAVFYHLLHAVVVFFLTWRRNPIPRGPAITFLVGIVFFSGSIYFLATGGSNWLGPITPIGGGAFLVGWAWLAFSKNEK